jgi:hypothetical protein
LGAKNGPVGYSKIINIQCCITIESGDVLVTIFGHKFSPGTPFKKTNYHDDPT